MGAGTAFLRAFGDLGHPAIRGAVWRALAMAGGSFAGLALVVQLLLARLQVGDGGWLTTAAGWVVGALGGLATVALTWILFPAVATFFVGLMLEGVAKSLEAQHYPGAPRGHGQGSLTAAAIAGLRFAAVAIALNLAALLVYAVLALTVVLAPLAPVAFYALNGYLLGREYYEIVALRHYGRDRVRELRRRHRAPVFAVGAGVAVLFTVPVVNLAAPLVGVAAMVHLFHGMPRARGPA